MTSHQATEPVHPEQVNASGAILFEDLVPGRDLGTYALTYDETFAQGWQRMIAQKDGPPAASAGGRRAQAASVSLMLMMRAFLTVVSPRPPGNIHARQSLSFCGLPSIGDHIAVTVNCLSKSLHKERRYVEFGVKAVNQGQESVFTGVLTLIWAA